jgi:type IV secretory pathway VirJ component
MASAAAMPPAEFPIIRYSVPGTVAFVVDGDGGWRSSRLSLVATGSLLHCNS